MKGATSRDLPLRSRTSAAWARAVLSDPLALLDDHAHLERKAAANALALLAGAHAVGEGARVLAAIARDEVEHLNLVLRLLEKRGGRLSATHRNPYASALHALVRRGQGRKQALDHLLVCALIEARSCERFEVLAAEAEDADLRGLYRGLCASERGHHRTFVGLAAGTASEREVAARWGALLDAEAVALAAQVPGPRMHSGEPISAAR
jgi:tRNA 2-(methylsulfanyl)-N6-isopentenyladenosine37 hydroxylase